MFDIIRYLLGFTIWFFVIGIACWRGAWPERLIAITYLVAILISPLVQERPFANHLQVNLLIVDATVLMILIWLSLRSDRWWPLFAAAASVLEVSTRIAHVFVPGLSLAMAVTGAILWSYVMLFALAGGIAEIEIRKRRSRTWAA